MKGIRYRGLTFTHDSVLAFYEQPRGVHVIMDFKKDFGFNLPLNVDTFLSIFPPGSFKKIAGERDAYIKKDRVKGVSQDVHSCHMEIFFERRSIVVMLKRPGQVDVAEELGIDIQEIKDVLGLREEGD